MSRVVDFLTDLSDFELAYFAKFKRQTYMTARQQEINDYLITRNLTEDKINELILSKPVSNLTDNNQRCPRCFSDKLIKENIEKINTSKIEALDSLTGKKPYAEKIVCNVCDYIIFDPNNDKRIIRLSKIWQLLTKKKLD